MASLETLETPALVLDRAKLGANCARMSAHLARSGVALRPHVKTAKSVEVARAMLGTDTGPLTVSTLKEAEHFAERGFGDLLYAVGLAPNKFERAAALSRTGVKLTVLVDSVAMATAFRVFCRAQGLAVPVMIEIDTDGHRAGLSPDSAELLRAAAVLAEGELFGGLLTHAGRSYDSKDQAEIKNWARAERAGITEAAARLRREGHAVPLVSLGSTPTALFAESFEGVDEVRAGVYCFFDLVMAGLGVCAVEEIALSVLVSVIGHQPDKGWLVTDGGWMALSRDRGTAGQRVDQGYGLVCDVRGVPGELVVLDANQEHGIVAAREGVLDVRDHPVGSLLRVLPNHACATAAQHAGYHVVGPDGELEAHWERLNGW
jgi:D-serine deaminase-like pyridoxal phosphate-dependent protein